MIRSRLKDISSEELNKRIQDILNNEIRPSKKRYKRPSVILKPVEDYEVWNNGKSSCINIKEFFKYHDEEFIKFCYRAILKREPDTEGFNYYLTKLRNGEYTKTDVITRLRYSKEGRKRGIKIKGLLPRAIYSVLSKRLIIGHIVKTFKILLTLPSIEKKLNITENNIYPKVLAINHEVKYLNKDLSLVKSDFHKELDLTKSHIEKSFADFNYRIYKLEDELYKINIPEVLEKEVVYNINKNISYYQSFENVFRGDENKVKEQQRIFLKYIPDNTDKSVLDIGSGRGEFLELLKENSINAIGVDINRDIVNYTKGKGLNCIYADGIEFLKNTDKKFRAITAFHIIEHMDTDKQRQLLEYGYQKLEKGGIIIIETPNPWFIYGLASFYTDITHIKPIPPETLVFLLQWIGFKNTKILYLNPITNKIPKGEREWIYYQSYAVVGKKE